MCILISPGSEVVVLQNDVAVAHNILLYVFVCLIKTEN